jgi:hypothetical protein
LRCERPLRVLEVEEHAHPGRHQLLEEVGRLDLLAAQARLLRHHEHLERRPRFQHIQQAGQAGTRVAKDGAADPVVGVDVGVGDGPALASGVRAGVLDLAGDTLGLIGQAALFRAFAGVDRGDHERRLLSSH